MRSYRSKTHASAKQDDDARLEAAIAARATTDKKSLGNEDPMLSTTSYGFSSANQTPAQGSPRELQVDIAQQPAAAKEATATTADAESVGPKPLDTCGGKAEALFFAALSVTDLLVRVALAAKIASYYGTERAESFWWLLALGLATSLVGVVFLVARVAGNPTATGQALQRRLETRQGATGVLLFGCVLQPELLRCLLPDAAHALTIVRIDTLASVLSGLPFLGMAVAFATEEKFGDRYGVLRAIASAATDLAGGTGADAGAGGLAAPCAAIAPPAAAAHPPSPPPPPFPPTDPSGETTVLAIWAASLLLLVLLLKSLRYLIAHLTHAQTHALRRQLASLQLELEAEKGARAAEYEELASLRDYCYGAQEEAGELQPAEQAADRRV